MIVSGLHLEIAEAAAKAHGFTLEQLRARDNQRALVAARRSAAYALRCAGASYPECGAVLHRDHTTIIYLIRTMPKVRLAAGGTE